MDLQRQPIDDRILSISFDRIFNGNSSSHGGSPVLSVLLGQAGAHDAKPQAPAVPVWFMVKSARILQALTVPLGDGTFVFRYPYPVITLQPGDGTPRCQTVIQRSIRTQRTNC